MRIAVLVFAYNRESHLRRVLEALSRCHGASNALVTCFSDGPKGINDMSSVDGVRRLLAEPRWSNAFKTFEVVHSPRNTGLFGSITSGVAKAFERCDAVCVLEDDCLPAVEYLQYMRDALILYSGDANVGSVTGFSPLGSWPRRGRSHIYHLGRSCSFGWGTWRDRWQKVDWSDETCRAVFRSHASMMRFAMTGTDKLGRALKRFKGDSKSWSIIFNVHHFKYGWNCVYPAVSLIDNIGYDGTGVHCRPGDGLSIERVGHEWRADYTRKPVWEGLARLKVFRQYSGGILRGMCAIAFYSVRRNWLLKVK